MIKELKLSNRVDNQPLNYLSAPKRKRESNDEISASRRQDDDDDDFVYPLHKRTNSANRALSSFCTASYDSERRDGPADSSDDVLDDETEALVKKFRTSVFRREPLPSATSRYLSPPSPVVAVAKYHDEEENDFFELPSLTRATTICDDSSSTDNSSCYVDPPDMQTSAAEEEILEQEEDHHDHYDEFCSSSLSLESSCHQHRLDGDDEEIEQARERPEWLSSSTGPTQPSPLWNMSHQPANNGSPFWPAGWTGMFHQGSA